MRLYRDPRHSREFPSEEWYGDTASALGADWDRPEGNAGYDIDVDVDAWLESDDWDELAELLESAPARLHTPVEAL